MNLTNEQVAAMAPDASSLSAGKKLGSAKDWKNSGQSDTALWGECQGSALYQVRIDKSDLAYKCTCPSRKLPCKHVLGLLFLSTGNAQAIAAGTAPEWVSEWLAKRTERIQKREEKKEAKAPPDAVAQAKRADQRHERILEGIARLDLWLNDIIRNGLASLETQSPAFWEDSARRLVDAQAPALATRVRRIGEIPGTGADWPKRILMLLGKLALLTHAYLRLDSLDAGLQADVRQLIGWTIGQEELTAQGEQVSDKWFVLGQTVEQEERLRVQRTWLTGQQTTRTALILQFSAAGQPFPQLIAPGTLLDADLVFWPGKFPQRAKLQARRESVSAWPGSPPGCATIEEFLANTATTLASQPWLDRFLCVLTGITPVLQSGSKWLLRDSSGAALPMGRADLWKLMSISGGRAIDLAAEWDGELLRPLSGFAENQYINLTN